MRDDSKCSGLFVLCCMVSTISIRVVAVVYPSFVFVFISQSYSFALSYLGCSTLTWTQTIDSFAFTEITVTLLTSSSQGPVRTWQLSCRVKRTNLPASSYMTWVPLTTSHPTKMTSPHILNSSCCSSWRWQTGNNFCLLGPGTWLSACQTAMGTPNWPWRMCCMHHQSATCLCHSGPWTALGITLPSVGATSTFSHALLQ